MKDSFVTEKFVLDLSGIKVSYVETNPRFKDSFFTKYSFPFEFHLTRDMKIKMGDYTNINAIGLEKKYHGYHIFEGRKRKGILEIIEGEGDLIRAQIDSGFEYFPNFEKKLSEIQFEKIKVNNIYTHAEEVCKKSYPAVNYNFLRVIYTKHLDEKGTWEYFNQFLNDRDENGFINNGENTTEPVNRNIIHPMPYLLYVLKKGFADAGFQIEGDILEDTDFKQRVIYNNKEIFNKNEHEPIEIVLTQNDEIAGYANIYEKSVILPEQGKWLLQVTAVCIITTEYGFMAINIELNGNEVYHRQYDVSGAIPLDIFIEMDNNVTNGTLKISMLSQITHEYPLFSGNVNLKSYLNIDNNTIFYIKNSNIIDISRSMPDMTFGDLVRTVKNWKNYDLEIRGKTVYMNRLEISSEMIDISDFEINISCQNISYEWNKELQRPWTSGYSEFYIYSCPLPFNTVINLNHWNSYGIRLTERSSNLKAEFTTKGLAYIEEHKNDENPIMFMLRHAYDVENIPPTNHNNFIIDGFHSMGIFWRTKT